MKYLHYKGQGPVRSDETAKRYFEIIGNPTFREVCDDILTNTKDWGYIGIYNKKNVWLGEPHIEYCMGSYVDNNRIVIPFNIPDEYADKKVISVDADGGWSMMNYIFKVE